MPAPLRVKKEERAEHNDISGNEMRFLDEVQALDAIRKMIADTGKARLAVAFWGKGAIEKLGLDRQGLKLEVLCNLESGACNPTEIAALRKLGAEVRTHPQLHGKVYWTPEAVILGSSNASANGLAVEASDLNGWREANLLISDSKVIAESKEWIDIHWEAGSPVDGPALLRAKALWKTRQAHAPPGKAMKSLLDAYFKTPDHPAWNKLKLVAFTDQVTSAARQEIDRFIAANPKMQDCDAYEGWTDLLHAGDWIVEFDATHQPATFNGYWKTTTSTGMQNALRYVRKQSTIRPSGFVSLELDDDEKGRLVRHLPAILANAKDGVIPFTLAMKRLRTAETEPGPREKESLPTRKTAFERAMRNIYEAARLHGYTANYFLGLINEHGGLAAAKRLLRPGPGSDGLASLYEKGLSHLSVEALVQKPEWRDLFTNEELAIARQRYLEPIAR